MQEALGLAHTAPFKTREESGWRVAWEAAGYAEDATALSGGAFFDFSSWACLRLTGPDAWDFLNRLSTLNFKSWDPARTRLGAFLTGRSGVVSLGFFQSNGKDSFRLWVGPEQKAALAEHIEKMHFAEKLECTDCSADWALFAVKGFDPGSVAAHWPDPRVSGLEWVVLPRTQAEASMQHWRDQGHPLVGERLYEYLRMQVGLPRVGRELAAQTMLLEAGLEDAVDRGKGCYPGQEVIERIFTYGQVNRKLVRVKWSGSLNPESLPLTFERDGKTAAVLVAADINPGAANAGIGLAFVGKQFWNPGEAFESPGLELVVA
ncbi:hypothetical protein K2X33_02980 [bacterium]|nr:hypothetical protein [bacterium]